MTPKLQDDAALKTEIDAVSAGSAASKGAQDWYARLAAFFAEVKAGVPGKLRDTAFLKKLWDDNPVAATGMGTVKVDAALADAAFQTWFATEVAKLVASDPGAAQAQLTELFDSLHSRMQVLCGRTPRLKINRVMCALYPEHFTSIADRGALLYLHQELGGSPNDHPVRAHQAIRTRLDSLLGPAASDDGGAQVRRVCLPWMLYERIANESRSEVDPTPPGDDPALRPLPASLRRRGLTAMKGSFQSLLGFMEDLREGLTRDEFAALVKQTNPDYSPQGVAMTIGIVAREFGLCKREGDAYRLTARGINFAQTQDPDEFADLLLTKVLGVDHVLKRLQTGGEGKAALLAMLQAVNPGWTTVSLPSTLMGWLASLDLIELDGAKKCRLTERGRRWAERITWVPELLPKVADFQPDEPAASTSTSTATTDVASLSNALELPSMAEVSARLEQSTQGMLIFPARLVAQLHAGLWSHPVRHFAVLTGISGSGKTQLALRYAQALCNGTTGDNAHVRVIPVQPGWYDPSTLLGYVNPIQDASYRSAPFLDLLLRAAADPQQPHVVILDEMNLSHPEQYLAPILSAMETHGWIDLHSLGDESTSVPMRLRYPSNLALIGTVNMDETTHGLSDKVLDRAYTLEFWDIEVADFPGWSGVSLPADLKDTTRTVLGELGAALAPVRLHFGWRTIDDVLGYLAFQAKAGALDADALDHVVYAKVLPKLRGDASPRFEKALQDTHAILKRHALRRCLAKVQAMQDDLLATGSARFWR